MDHMTIACQEKRTFVRRFDAISLKGGRCCVFVRKLMKLLFPWNTTNIITRRLVEF